MVIASIFGKKRERDRESEVGKGQGQGRERERRDDTIEGGKTGEPCSTVGIAH